METQNKQWVCHPAPVVDNHGQLGPEDLSSNSRTATNQNASKGTVTITTAVSTEQLVSDVQNRNGLDHHFVQQVEDAICENSRQIIIKILDEVTRLSSIEKLLLYLKLPTDLNNVSDPLRQPLNPLGSRTEISQTIMWIKTHLEEEPELSLPKQEVYNEYTVYCANNNMKPLSTADFGKVMKQVYPSVRPRRLGTRGNSRYCYAGLHKRFKLEVPQLPDLCDMPKSTEKTCTPSELITAAWTIIKEWAETVLGTQFQNVCALAKYLVNNVLVNSTSVAACLVKSVMDSPGKDVISPELPYSSLGNFKHKEAQFQLQRKLHQREAFREHKRKLQLQSPKTESKNRCKKGKLQVNIQRTDSSDLESPKSQGAHQNQACDKTNEHTVVPLTPTLPDFSSFQLKKPEEIPEKITPQPSPPHEHADKETKTVLGKLPIPRLPNQKLKLNVVPVKHLMPMKKCPRSLKYKAIQPKPVKCDTKEATQGSKQNSLDVVDGTFSEQLQATDYMTRERLISVSNVDKDALDDYLHGGNNSQEQEEELLQYFKNTAETSETDESKTKCDKLSQLRLLLEQNLNAVSETATKVIGPKTSIFTKTSEKLSIQNLAKRRVSFETETVPPSPNTRRKNFSFTPISPGPLSPTNASPFVSPRNTPVPRAKVSHMPNTATSFVATSRKHKPTLKPIKHEGDVFGDSEKLFADYIEEKHFVSPTDLMPKCNATMSAPPSPMMPYKTKLNNSNLLQKLLDSNSKVPYVPDYEKSVQTTQQPSFDNLSQEVTQLLSENNQGFAENSNSYRSQSVPLHQMASFKSHISPCVLNTQQTHFNFNFMSANNSVGVTPVPIEFSDFEPFPDSEALINNSLNNENINHILNILETPAPLETAKIDLVDNSAAVYPFDNTFITQNREAQQATMMSKLVRSQSIDMDLDMQGMCEQKYNPPSRSVPNTPLPFTKLDPIELNLNNNNTDAQFQNEDLQMGLFNQDFLLNGQPVKGKLNAAMEFANTNVADNNKNRLVFGREVRVNVDNFGARRNLNPLLEQQYGDTEDFTAVPNTTA